MTGFNIADLTCTVGGAVVNERNPPRVFFDLPARAADPSTAAAVILPVPYDRTSSWLKGAAGGPDAILEASQYVEVSDLETSSEPWRSGIGALAALEFDGPPEALAEQVAARVGRILAASQLPIVLGGEHSVTIGAVRAAAAAFPRLSVLQIDAHADTRESYGGSTHSHTCVMARVREVCPIVPATGTPELGGLNWYQVNDLMAEVARCRNVVGFDVVELLPGHPPSAFLAAKLIYRFLAEILASEKARGA